MRRLVFGLESKVQAPLKAEQMRRYRCNNRGEYLVAITKRSPEVGRAWIASAGAFSIRWQEVHRTLAQAPALGKDRYLCDSFCAYLEELGMAHRDDVTLADLNQLHRLFRHIGAARKSKIDPNGCVTRMQRATLFPLRRPCVTKFARMTVPRVSQRGRLNWGQRVARGIDRMRYAQKRGAAHLPAPIQSVPC